MATNSSLPPHQPDDARTRRGATRVPSNAESLRERYGWTARYLGAPDAMGIGPIPDDDDDEDEDHMGDMSFAELCMLLFVVFVICLGSVFVAVSPIIMILVAWWALFG